VKKHIKYNGLMLLMVFISIGVPVFCQNTTSYKHKKFTFHIEKKDTSISFDVCAVNPKVDVNQNSLYAWYSDRSIMETKGGFSGKLLDGQYISYYGNKNLQEKGMYIQGRKEGKWIKWHPNGKINEVIYWRNGEKRGKYYLYNDAGQKMLFAHFKHDKLNGTAVSYEKDQKVLKTKYKDGKEVFPQVTKQKPEKVHKEKQKEKKPSSVKPFTEKIKSFFKKKERNEKTPVKEKKKKVDSKSPNIQ
jgi:hypothetical protein